MIVTVLGCGTSTGVPLIGCPCSVCKSSDPRNQRLRASIWIQVDGKCILVDTATDLRQQALRFGVNRVDAVLYTHPHTDHVHGIDELRSFNFAQKASIPMFGNDWTCFELSSRFGYIFKPGPVEGGGIPQLTLTEFDSGVAEISVLGIPVIPVSLRHGSKESIGYRIRNFAYLTDLHTIPTASWGRLHGLDTLILDCLRLTPHNTHLTLTQSLEIVAELKPRQTFLTHMGHDFNYPDWVGNGKLPNGVQLAYDGLEIRVNA